MTIKELYDWGTKNNLENYELVLNTLTGKSTAYYSIGDLIVNEDLKEIHF